MHFFFLCRSQFLLNFYIHLFLFHHESEESRGWAWDRMSFVPRIKNMKNRRENIINL